MIRMRRVLAALAAVMLAGACGGNGDGDGNAGGGAPEADITVAAREFSFDPAEITLEAGQNYTIALDNRGQVEHDLVVDEANNFKVYAAVQRTAEGRLTAPAAGTYEFYCSVPGHRPAGMVGTLTVQ